ncbi:MAG: PD-(D/E)XK nuclease family transposase, partial [Deltaproteobacteria bacterium]|nr:PD-(D/E)XK nuclease family transposase [Deltaproteobacteria bacterium]
MLVELEGGKLVDVEMQCDFRGGHGARWLYHWARLFSSRLRRGDDYERLEPVVCIVFLAARSDASRFHATYEVREVHDHSALSDVLAVHVLHLPRLEQAATEGEGAELQRWARFLRFENERALDSLARESPVMADAKHALELLSREPSAQRIAEMRREA